MFTDIKGFSGKMAKNEAAAFELLKTHDAIMRVLTAKFNGKVVKSIGDSFMVDFSSAVNAVKCAIETQKRFWAFNRGKSEFDKIEIRTGIHVGDVLIRGDDIYGDGVNIASRIEALTDPSRICISSDTYNQVRNKMELSVFSLGALELKNIPEPVEVFEVLIPSIPELSKPSAKAVDASLKKKTAEAGLQQAEESRESQHVEQREMSALVDQIKEEEIRREKISERYTQAEKFFDSGQINEAEQALKEISKIDPNYLGIIDRQKKEDEIGQQIQAYVDRAHVLLKEGKLDEAELEVNEVFRLLPLHGGAQQVLSLIEEERYRRQEQQRIKFVEVGRQPKSGQQPKSDQQEKVDQLLDQTRRYLETEQFKDAKSALQSIYLLDPNNSSAHRLSESVQQAEQAKAELLRIQAKQEEEKRRFEKLAVLQRKLGEQKARKAAAKALYIRQQRVKRISTISVVILLIILTALELPHMLEWFFPKKTSIAVLRFTRSDSNSTRDEFAYVLPLFLSKDLSQCQHLKVISSTTSFLFDPKIADYAKIALELSVEYILIGTVQEHDGRYRIVFRLLRPAEQKVVSQDTLEGSLASLHNLRNNILTAVISKMGIRTPLPEIRPPTKNIAGYVKYLDGIMELQQDSLDSMEQAEQRFREALDLDPVFPSAQEALARVELSRYISTKEIFFLEKAREYAQSALKVQSNLAEASFILGEYYVQKQQFQKAVEYFGNSLQLQPQNPEVLRKMSLLSLMTGNSEQAQKYAQAAVDQDPKNPESYRTQGLAWQAEKKYPAAASAFKEVIHLGSQDSLTTTDYLLNVWMSSGLQELVIQYCELVVKTYPEDYRYYYWCGRAYQSAMKINNAQQWLEDGLVQVENCLDANPADALAQVYKGLFLTRLGKFSEGEAAAVKALEMDTASGEIGYRLANVLSIQGNKVKALAAFKKALDKHYCFLEVWNPDESKISDEPEFHAVTRKIIDIPPFAQ